MSETDVILTPLEKVLPQKDSDPATPLTVFKSARGRWLECKRISIGELAAEAGVSRVTIYRWVGSRNQLIEEILWSFAQPAFEKATQTASGKGVEYIVETHRRFMAELIGCEPLRRFLIENPSESIRIQTNDPMGAHGRVIQAAAKQLADQQRLGHLQLPAPAARVAELMVYTSSSLLYSAIIGNRDIPMAVEQSCMIDRLLLLGELDTSF